VTQEFTKYNGTESDKPLPDTDIRLVFSESVQGIDKNAQNQTQYTPWKDFTTVGLSASSGTAGSGTTAATTTTTTTTTTGDSATTTTPKTRDEMAAELSEHITLYEVVNGKATEVNVRDSSNADTIGTDWTIDFRFAQVSVEDGKMIVTLPTTKDSATSALNLKGGADYLFKFNGIADAATKPNSMGNNVSLPQFTTVYAQVVLSTSALDYIKSSELSAANSDLMDKDSSNGVRIDLAFEMDPLSTSSAVDTDRWDMLLWSDKTVTFQLYRREITSADKNPEWELVTGTKLVYNSDGSTSTEQVIEAQIICPSNQTAAISLFDTYFRSETTNQIEYTSLKEDLLDTSTYEYGIHFTSVGRNTEYASWGDEVNMTIGVVAGSSLALRNLAGSVPQDWSTLAKTDPDVTSIGLAYTKSTTSSTNDRLPLQVKFQDNQAPQFINNSPRISTPGSTTVDMTIYLDREATVYYVAIPAESLPAKISAAADGELAYDSVPEQGNGSSRTQYPYTLTSPVLDQIITSNLTYITGVQQGTWTYQDGATPETISGLTPDTDYYVYFALKGSSSVYSSVMVYRFHTKPVNVPIITLYESSPSVSIETSEDSQLYYALVNSANLANFFSDDLSNYTSGNEAYDALAAGSAEKATVDSLTVIQALTTSRTDKRSYFDVYANDALRQNVLEYIMGNYNYGTGKLPADKNADSPINLVAGDSINKDFTNVMTTENTYYLLAAAIHSSLQSEYGFKAVGSVCLPNNDPPQYTGGSYVGATIDYGILKTDTTNAMVGQYGLDGWGNHPSDYKFTGSFTIDFDQAIYTVVNDGTNTTRKGVVMLTNGGTAGADQIDIMTIIGGSGNFKAKDSTTGDAGSSFSFTFTDLKDRDTLVLFDGSYFIGNKYGVSSKKKLYATFYTNLTGADYGTTSYGDAYVPGFVLEWK
jgi:hypothetical protein